MEPAAPPLVKVSERARMNRAANHLSETLDKMALLVLIVLGATLGWLASILARTEAPATILRQVALGMVVSVVTGEFANEGTMIGSLSFLALGVALAATAVALVLYHAIFNRGRVKV